MVASGIQGPAHNNNYTVAMLRPHSTVASPSLHCAMSGLGFGGSFQNPGNVGWLAGTVNYWLAGTVLEALAGCHCKAATVCEQSHGFVTGKWNTSMVNYCIMSAPPGPYQSQTPHIYNSTVRNR